MKLFPRTRATIRRFAWRLGYAGRVLEKTTYDFSEAYGQAKLAQSIHHDTWMFRHPTEAADHRLGMTCPAHMWRPVRGQND